MPKKIQAIFSDLDSTLINFKEIHYEALNKALAIIDPIFVINEQDHIKTFDGLSTKKKLKILSEKKNFPVDKIEEVNSLKQKFTLELIENFTNFNYSIVDTVKSLKEEGYIFYVVSNAVRETIEVGLKKLGIYKFVDKIYSNENAKNQKPHPEIYLRCMADAGVSPQETLIIEDSAHGRNSAAASGAHVCDVDDSFDFTYDAIKSSIQRAEQKNLPIKYPANNKLNILIPMAGLGSRFKLNYSLPKPLIDVNGKPMIQRVVENLNIDANYTFIVQKEHYEKYNLETLLSLIVPNCKIVQTEGVTQGAACTTLLAKELINNDKHLLIANSDQLADWNSAEFLYSMNCSNADGGIITFHRENETKWSYAKVDELNFITEVAEKNPISNFATIGIYYFSKGSDYVTAAENMIDQQIKIRNEYFVCPVYNELIKVGKKIKNFTIENFYGLGTPEDLAEYLKLNN